MTQADEDGFTGCGGERLRRAADPVDREAHQALRLPATRRRVRALARGEVFDGVPPPGEGLAIPHELTDFQEDFLGAKADLLAARRQLDAAGKAAF
jgi:hypothetical protein